MIRPWKPNKKYFEMSPLEKQLYTKDMTSTEWYNFHREELRKLAQEQQQAADKKRCEKEQQEQITRAIEKEIVKTLEKEFKGWMK